MKKLIIISLSLLMCTIIKPAGMNTNVDDTTSTGSSAVADMPSFDVTDTEDILEEPDTTAVTEEEDVTTEKNLPLSAATAATTTETETKI